MKSKIVLAALALGLLSSTANAGILYDRYNRPFVVNSSCAKQGNISYCYRNGMLSSMSVRHGNVIKVYNATGYIGHIRDYGRAHRSLGMLAADPCSTPTRVTEGGNMTRIFAAALALGLLSSSANAQSTCPQCMGDGFPHPELARRLRPTPTLTPRDIACIRANRASTTGLERCANQIGARASSRR